MNVKSNQLLAQVHPNLAARIIAAAATLLTWGYEIRVVSGLRSAAEQDAEFAKGRTVLKDAAGKPQGIVTNARGGQSSHNFGLAVDVVPGVAGVASWTPQWSARAPEFVAMVKEMKRQGLAWGGDWTSIKGDFDHFYLANSPASPTDAMRADLAQGLSTVYACCDAGNYMAKE